MQGLILFGKRVTRHLGWEIHRFRPRSSEAARLQHLLAQQRVDVVLDVGANSGQYARALREGGYQGGIVSFEPLADAHALLQRNARRDTRWTVAPAAAAGNYEGAIEIHVAANSASSSILPMHATHLKAAPESAYTGVQKVRIAPLDILARPYLTEGRRAFVKIDTQGYEKAVLEGAENVLRQAVGVQIEASLVELYAGQILYRELIEHLESRGFELFDLLPGFNDPATGRLLQMDCVFVRRTGADARG